MNLRIGRRGEELAAKFLRNKGYQIIGRNFRTRFGEIDLIVKKGGLLVFVEVKTVAGDSAGEPEWRISKNKIRRVRKMAEIYLIKKQPDYENLRIDAVCLVLGADCRPLRTTHYENLV